MKRVRTLVAISVAPSVVVAGYLAIVGMNDDIEAVSTGNVVRFSSPALAAQASTINASFRSAENVTVRLEGVFAGTGALAPDELNLKVEMTGRHRRRLLDPAQYFVCSEAEMKEQIRSRLVELTGDESLQIMELSLGYLSTDAQGPN